MKNSILIFLRWVYHSLLLGINMVLSLIRVLFYSKLNTRCPLLREIKDRVLVLGNGPSVKQLINDNIQFLSTQNLVVVNDFFLSRYFTTIKPRVYVIADPVYWEEQVPDNMLVLRQKMQHTLMNDVDWEMLFFVPSGIFKTSFFHQIYQANTHIHIQPFNVVPFIGTKRMRYIFYDKLLAKPLSGNVIGSALFIALQMDIKEIYLFGVEHSWTRSLYVDDQNRTCIELEHFYTENQQGTVWLKSNAEPYTINQALFDIATMLGGYREINEYALQKDIKIYNCTPDSFIDAFERKKWIRPI